jgi:outer membrane protein TolC
VDVRSQSLELAKKQADLTHEQMRAGSVPTSALHAVEYEIATRTAALLAAQLVVEKQSLDLRRQAGLELGQRAIVMKPSEPFEIGDEEFDVDDVLARSRIANRQLASIEIEKKIAEVDSNVARDQRKPQVDLSFTGALIGQGEDSGSSLSGLADGDSFQVSVGLSVSFELSGAARRQHMAAETKKHHLDIDRADAERQIEVAVVTAVHQVTAARARVGLSDKAIEMAEENVRAERANFLVSRSTNFQVMQRQDELIQARLDRGRAIADYHEAVAQLQFLSGLILQQYRVNVRPSAGASRG